MVKRVLEFLHKEVNGLHEAAYLLGFFTLLSQVLALFRDRIFASKFGAGETLDIYYSAFRVPDLILVTAASVVSASILIPFLVEKMKSGATEARRFGSAVFSAFFLFIAALSLAAFIATPWLSKLFFPGFSAGALSQVSLLTRIMLLQPIFLGLSNFFASITQLYGRFFVYAVSPLLYNLGIIFGALVLYPRYGLSGLAMGVVFGAFLHFLIQVPVVFRTELRPRFSFDFKFWEIWRVAAVSLPRTVALSLANLSSLFLIALGSFLAAGSIAVFNLSWNLQSAPLAIVGASYSLAAFPTLAKLFSGGAHDKFFLHLAGAARHIIFWSVPAAVLFVVLRAQIVRTILGSGAFDWGDTRLTAASLAFFAVSAVSQGLALLFTRAYYARGKTLKPLLFNGAAALATAVFGFGLLRLFDASLLWRFFTESLMRVSDLPGAAVLMLPLAYTLAMTINAVLFWLAFSKDFPKWNSSVLPTFFHSFSASVIMGFISYLLLNVFDDVFNLDTLAGIFLQGLLSGLGGIAVGILLLVLMKNEELREIWRTLHHKIWKAKVIGADAADAAL